MINIIGITFIVAMFLKDFIFPKLCLGCGSLGCYICLKCQKKLRYIEKDLCFYCQQPSFFGLTHPSCKKKNGIDGLISIFYYNDLLKKIIKNIKYQLALDVFGDLKLIIRPEKLIKISFYKKLANDFYFQPIPLYISRYRKRGFNQAELLTDFFQKYLPFPKVDLLIRKKETKPQAQINQQKKRFLNIRGAFRVADEKKVLGRNFILIDDVITTGGTVREAAQILKRKGANKVFVLTLAKS